MQAPHSPTHPLAHTPAHSHAGLATVYVPQERYVVAQERLLGLRTVTLDSVATALNEHAADPGMGWAPPFCLRRGGL